jgi:hypothetical protein
MSGKKRASHADNYKRLAGYLLPQKTPIQFCARQRQAGWLPLGSEQA